MNPKRRFCALFTACILCGTAMTASAATYDADGDGNITMFDYIIKKREALENPTGTAFGEMQVIGDYLAGYGAYPYDTPEPAWLLEAPGTAHSGYATWYTGGITSGRCSLAPIPEGLFVCAINPDDYALGLLAGAYLRVTAENGNTVDVYVTDTSAEAKGSLDLNVNAFEQLAPRGTGRLNISWQIIPFPTSEPIGYRFTEDSSTSWFCMQLRYHTLPVWSVEILKKDGTYTPLKRRSDNYFTGSGFGAGPFTFRLTDVFGNVITEEGIPLSPGEMVVGKMNFPV